MREVVYKPLGVITQPNKYGQFPPGALKNGIDVCMRDPGVLRNINDWMEFQEMPLSSTSQAIARMWALSASFLAACYDTDGADDSRLIWADASTTTLVTGPGGSAFECDEAGIVQMVNARDRSIVTNDVDPWVLDSEGDADARYIGLPRPTFIHVPQFYGTNTQALASATRVKYRVIFKRKFDDGYLLRSPPSNVVDITNTTGITVDVMVRVEFNNPETLAELQAGDIVSVYRTDPQASAVDPGETYRLALEYTLISTDISNGYVEIRDSKASTANGEELYTNSGLLENGENGAPGQCTDAFNFKGYTWYAERERAQSIQLQFSTTGTSAGVPVTSAQRLSGIGKRVGSGTRTNTSATIMAIGAVDMVGLAIGQVVNAAGFAAGLTITAIGATSITLNGVAGSSGATAFTAYDSIEIGGIVVAVDDADLFFEALASVDLTYMSNAPGVIAVLGQSVYQGNPGVLPAYDYPTRDFSFRLTRQRFSEGSFTLRASNGQNYSPQLPSMSDTPIDVGGDPRDNRLVTSKLDQPEAVVPGVETVYGHGAHYRAITRRDNTLLFASDGLWQLSGEAGQWRTDLIDKKLVLSARNAVCQIGGIVFAYTNQGLVAITEGNQVLPVTKGVIGDQLPGLSFRDTWRLFMEADEQNDEVWLVDDEGAHDAFYFNTLTKSWFTCSRRRQDTNEVMISAMAYAPFLEAMGFASYAPGGESSVLARIYEYDPDVVVDTAYADFQPITGDGNTFTAKQWVDFGLVFQSVGSQPMSATMRFAETSSHAQTTVADGYDYRISSGVPLAYGVAPRITPGFTMRQLSGTPVAWALAALSLRYEVVSEEYMR